MGRTLGRCLSLECEGKVKLVEFDDKEYATCKQCEKQIKLSKYLKKKDRLAKTVENERGENEDGNEASGSLSRMSGSPNLEVPYVGHLSLDQMHRLCEFVQSLPDDKLFPRNKSRDQITITNWKVTQQIHDAIRNELATDISAKDIKTVLYHQAIAALRSRQMSLFDHHLPLIMQHCNSDEAIIHEIKSHPDFPKTKKYSSSWMLFLSRFCARRDPNVKSGIMSLQKQARDEFGKLSAAEKEELSKEAKESVRDYWAHIESFISNHPEYEKYKAILIPHSKSLNAKNETRQSKLVVQFQDARQLFVAQFLKENKDENWDEEKAERKSRKAWKRMDEASRHIWEKKFDAKQTQIKRKTAAPATPSTSKNGIGNTPKITQFMTKKTENVTSRNPNKRKLEMESPSKKRARQENGDEHINFEQFQNV